MTRARKKARWAALAVSDDAAAATLRALRRQHDERERPDRPCHRERQGAEPLRAGDVRVVAADRAQQGGQAGDRRQHREHLEDDEPGPRERRPGVDEQGQDDRSGRAEEHQGARGHRGPSQHLAPRVAAGRRGLRLRLSRGVPHEARLGAAARPPRPDGAPRPVVIPGGLRGRTH